MRCTHCHSPVKQIVKVSEGSTFIRHALCPFCSRVADEYAIYKKRLFKDLLLFRPEPFIHLVFNSSYNNTHKIVIIRALFILINTLDRIEDTVSILDIFISISYQLVEISFLCICFYRSIQISKILYITTILSGISILKIFISLSTLSISNLYYQMCNILILLMTAKALSIIISSKSTTALSILIVLRMISSRLFYSTFQI